MYIAATEEYTVENWYIVMVSLKGIIFKWFGLKISSLGVPFGINSSVHAFAEGQWKW